MAADDYTPTPHEGLPIIPDRVIVRCPCCRRWVEVEFSLKVGSPPIVRPASGTESLISKNPARLAETQRITKPKS